MVCMFAYYFCATSVQDISVYICVSKSLFDITCRLKSVFSLELSDMNIRVHGATIPPVEMLVYK